MVVVILIIRLNITISYMMLLWVSSRILETEDYIRWRIKTCAVCRLHRVVQLQQIFYRYLDVIQLNEIYTLLCHEEDDFRLNKCWQM